MKTLSILMTTWLLTGQAPAETPPESATPAAAAPAATAPAAATPEEGAKAPDLLLEAEPAPAPTLETPKEIDPSTAVAASPEPPEETTKETPKKAALPPKKALRLLVMDLVDKGAGADVASSVSAAVGSQAIKSHTGEVVTTQQIKVALDAAAVQALVGCEAAACMTDVAKQVEADRVLGGNVSKVGDDLLLTLVVVEASTGARVSELQRKVPVYEDMYYYAAKEMTALVLTGQATDSLVPVRVEASQPGAEVVVDGQVRGVTPITLKLDPGAHEIRVNAKDFASWRTLAEVQEATPLAVHADLVAERLHLWPAALVVSGVSLAAAAGATATGVWSLELYDGSVTKTPGALQRSYLFGEPVDSLTLAQRRVEVQRWQLASNVLWGAAGVLGLSAVALETADLVLGVME